MPDKPEFVDHIIARLRSIANTIPELKEDLNPDLKNKLIENIQNNAGNSANELQSFQGNLWYLKENEHFESRNLLISAAPTVLGIILIFIVFFWTIQAMNTNNKLKSIIAIQDSTIETYATAMANIQVFAKKGIDTTNNSLNKYWITSAAYVNFATIERLSNVDSGFLKQQKQRIILLKEHR